ncbi:MAG TPA: calcium-binding protein, partial [Vicinamibacterales bacterium]
SEAVQAKQTLNLLMDAALLGVDGVVLYQLFNGVGEPVRDPTNFGQNYGLFRSPLDADPSVMSSAKPVAHAIHNLTTILSENPATNMLAGFGYAISGTGVDGKTFASSSLLLDTATGAKDIVIWSEPDIWNEATDTEILAGSSVATISFGTQIVRARIFDPLLDSVVQSEVSYAITVNVNVSDHPLIVQIIATGIDVVGTSAVNVLNGGTGEDRLSGLAGNDTLDGKAGADLMIGGIGNDTYVVDNLGDLVVENLGEGTDTVKTTFDYILGDNIEKLTFTGTAGAHGTGNALANTLLGNTGDNVLVGLAGKDVLTGGAGNDTLIGGEGLDTLTGGVGNDRFVLDSLTVSANRDTIKDFATGQDLIVIDRSVFTAFAGDAAGALDPADFFVGTAAQTSAQHLIFNSANGGLYYDADGAGGAVQVQIAALTNFAAIAPLAASDIVLI